MSDTRLEIMWGTRLLDEGFTSVPNILIRNYRKLGIEHGENGFLLNILTYKHDTRDPHPSRETLAANMCCSTKQVDKWKDSLKRKKLLRTGRRRNPHNKQWDTLVYDFKPLLDQMMILVGEKELPEPAYEYEILWDDDEPVEPQVLVEPKVPVEPEVGGVLEPEVGGVLEPQVLPKKKSKKENKKDDDKNKKRGQAPNSSPSIFYENNLEIIERFRGYAISMGLHKDHVGEITTQLPYVNFILTQNNLGEALIKTLNKMGSKDGCSTPTRYFMAVLENTNKGLAK